MDQAASDLASLGLNGYEASVYLALLSRNGASPSELAGRAKVPRQRVYDILESLESKGLCTPRDTSPKTYFAIDPKLALDALSRLRSEELEHERKRIDTAAHALMSELVPLFQAGCRENDPLQYVEILGDSSRIATRAIELARGAKRSVNSNVKRPLVLSADQNRRFLHAPLEGGVRYRALYERSALHDDELRAWMIELAAKGQVIRVVPELPLKMQLFDDEVALVSMQDPVGGPPSFTALVIRHRGMVALLNLAFEKLWEQGEPVGE